MKNHKKQLEICAYNVHGLFNKINYPYFFIFFYEHDTLCCLETHVFKSIEQEQLTKRLPSHNLYWETATRTAVKGRGVGGLLIGWRKNIYKRLNAELIVVKEGEIKRCWY